MIAGRVFGFAEVLSDIGEVGKRSKAHRAK
jgi:hypothetical protein